VAPSLHSSSSLRSGNSNSNTGKREERSGICKRQQWQVRSAADGGGGGLGGGGGGEGGGGGGGGGDDSDDEDDILTPDQVGALRSST